MSKATKNTLLPTTATILVVSLLLLMPFHGVLSVVSTKLLGSNFPAAWKEIVILILASIMLLKTLQQKHLPFKFDLINSTAVAIIGISLLISLLVPSSAEGFIFGFKTNCIPLLLFLVVQSFDIKLTSKQLIMLILVPATIVATLSLAQAITRPLGFLTSLGYNEATINPVQIVDGSLSQLRSFATLGGPNQLAVYLILPICLAIAIIVVKKKYWLCLLLLFFYVASLVTYSRSGWIGSLIASFAALLLSVKAKSRLYITIASIITAAILSIIVYNAVTASTDSDFARILLHGRNFNGEIQGSDEGRLSSIQRGVDLALPNPLGLGLGSAGPASQQTDLQVITENWYLQILIEIGFIGLVLYLIFFSSLLIVLIKRTLKQKDVIVVATIGLCVGVLSANFFLHSLADSTVAIILMLLLGLAYKKDYS